MRCITTAVLVIMAITLSACKQEVPASAANSVSVTPKAVPQEPEHVAKSIDRTDVAKCAAISNTIQRLACFDALAIKYDLVTKTEPTMPASSGEWRTFVTTDPLTDKSIYFANLDAKSGKGRYGDTISLHVRCKDSRTEFYIDWASYLGMDSTTVTHRVDKDQARTSEWGVSTDHKASFFPGSPIALLKQMASAQTFVANVTPYGESPVTAVFDIVGADNALADVRRGCAW